MPWKLIYNKVYVLKKDALIEEKGVMDKIVPNF